MEQTAGEKEEEEDIPPPIRHLILKRCPFVDCNEGYFTIPGYRGHYALIHYCKLPKYN